MPCYRPATRFGGPIESVHGLAVGLRRLGHEVAVFATNSDGARDLDVATRVEHDVDRVAVTYFPVAWPRGYFRAPELRQALRKRVREFDLAYIPWLYVDPSAAAAAECARQGVPYVISPRGMLDRNMIRKKGRLRKTAYLTLVAGRHLRDASAVHFTSVMERDRVWERFDNPRTFVVPNGLDTAALESPRAGGADLLAALPPGKQVVLFLGRLSYIKGLDVLARAWPIVARAVADAHLVLAGPDGEGLHASFEHEIAAAGVAPSVSYVGPADPAQRLALLRRCVLLAAPSHSDSFGMSIVEAMSQGKPVVVSEHVGIAPEIAASGAGRVVASDPAQLARAVIDTLRDPQQALRMGACGRALAADQFSVPAVARRMEAEFAKVAARAP